MPKPTIPPRPAHRPEKWGEPTQGISLRVPASLLAQIDQQAKKWCLSRSEEMLKSLRKSYPGG